jgi:hypothetical protein
MLSAILALLITYGREGLARTMDKPPSPTADMAVLPEDLGCPFGRLSSTSSGQAGQAKLARY